MSKKDSPTTAHEEDEIQWTDDQIRWTDGFHPNDDDAAAMLDPFRQDSRQTFSYQFRVDEEDGLVNIELNGFRQDSDEIWKSTGMTVWKAAEFLSDYLVQHRAELLRNNQRVLELGAGLGLCGVLAHSLTANTVCVTDGDTDVLPLLRSNVERNKRNDKLSCRQLLWGRGSSENFLKQQQGDAFDVILAADIIYATSIIEPLLETIQVLLKKTGVFVMAFKTRDVPVDIGFVLERSRVAGFVSECVETDDALGVFVYTFRWKNEIL